MNIKDWKMKTYNFEIRDEVGIYARPAGLLVKESKKNESRIIIKKMARLRSRWLSWGLA